MREVEESLIFNNVQQQFEEKHNFTEKKRIFCKLNDAIVRGESGIKIDCSL